MVNKIFLHIVRLEFHILDSMDSINYASDMVVKCRRSFPVRSDAFIDPLPLFLCIVCLYSWLRCHGRCTMYLTNINKIIRSILLKQALHRI